MNYCLLNTNYNPSIKIDSYEGNYINFENSTYQSLDKMILSLKDLIKKQSLHLSTKICINKKDCNEENFLFELDLFYNYNELTALYYELIKK